MLHSKWPNPAFSYSAVYFLLKPTMFHFIYVLTGSYHDPAISQ